MTRSIQVPRILFIASAVVGLMTVEATSLQAQADSGRLAMQEQRLSADRKKRQEQQPAPIPRGNSASDYGRIGANPHRGREVPPKCEDAYAMAAQIMAGGPVDRQVTSRSLGSLDASQGLPTPPFQPRMAPRDTSFRSSARHGRSEINKSLNSMRRQVNPAGVMHGC